MIENDFLGDWGPEKDCCWQLMFRQPVQKPSLESSVLLHANIRNLEFII